VVFFVQLEWVLQRNMPDVGVSLDMCVPGVVPIVTVRALGCCGFAFFILGNTHVSKVWFGANATVCLTPALGVMVAKPLAFTTVCGLRVVFSKSEGAENA